MTIYTAFLRGINVGGKNIVRMAELKELFEAIGLYEVQTYIQSGNVLFKSAEDRESLQKRIQQKFEGRFGFSSTVILRSAAQLEQITLNCPFSQEEIAEAELASEVESLYVALLSQLPLQERPECLEVYSSEADRYGIVGSEVFILLSHSIRKSKLANNLQRLDTAATVRNWKTINKLVELTRAMKGE